MLLTLKEKKILFFAFIAGFSMMVIELTASRILAPIVGLSLYTWTSVIGTILLGMVIGNFIGGFLIDKWNRPATLQGIYYSASISVLLVPVISRLISRIILLDQPLFIITIAAALLLFMLPSVAMGAIYPCLFKLEILNFSDIGFRSGKLSATWSLGSIAGTFFTGFYFIDHLGSINTLVTVALVLFMSGFLIFPKKYMNVFF